MNEALKQIVVPELRKRGYKGSLPHFRRIRDKVDIVTFQFDKWGGGFVIETAKGEKEGLVTSWGKHIPADKLTTWDFNFDERRRIQAGSGGKAGDWFRFDGDQDCRVVAQLALKLLFNDEHQPPGPTPTTRLSS
jgi:hypothetical protein